MSKLEEGQVLIHGKIYDTVARRVKLFRDEYGTELNITTELLSADDSTVVMKASISKGDNVIATGHAEENRQASTINRTSALENCETSAIGRALAAFGLAGTEFASADEVAQAISLQSPQKAYKTLIGPATDKQRSIINKHLLELGIDEGDQAGYLIETYGVEIPLTKEGASFVIGEFFDEN